MADMAADGDGATADVSGAAGGVRRRKHQGQGQEEAQEQGKGQGQGQGQGQEQERARKEVAMSAAHLKAVALLCEALVSEAGRPAATGILPRAGPARSRRLPRQRCSWAPRSWTC